MDLSKAAERKGILNSIGRSLAITIRKLLILNLIIFSMHMHTFFVPLTHHTHQNHTVGNAGRRLVERPPGYPQRNQHALLAGAIGGYVVWGRYNKINVQINLYLLSRVIIALTKKAGWHVEDSKERYAWFAAAIWGIVMLLFEEEPESLHSSLKMSMDEIYRYELPVKV
jgi:hypothetical protein